MTAGENSPLVCWWFYTAPEEVIDTPEENINGEGINEED
jgi:hypothetical protein